MAHVYRGHLITRNDAGNLVVYMGPFSIATVKEGGVEAAHEFIDGLLDYEGSAY